MVKASHSISSTKVPARVVRDKDSDEVQQLLNLLRLSEVRVCVRVRLRVLMLLCAWFVSLCLCACVRVHICAFVLMCD
jgi:hypothetical protein